MPSPFVTVAVDTPVSTFVAVTVTPGAIAPVESVTVPVIVARFDCASSAPAKKN